MNPSFGIIAPNYGRQKILALWGASIQRLRNELGIDIPACVISGQEDSGICEKYILNHIIAPNTPVTNKFNLGTEWIRDMGLDYMIISGSDDIFSTGTIKQLIVCMEAEVDLIGIDNIYFYAADGIHRGSMCRLRGKRILGPAKTISAKVLKKIKWKPWTKDKNWGMDALVTQAIQPHVGECVLLRDSFVCDVKTRENLNKATMWMKKLPKINPQAFYNILSEEEKQILFSI